MSNLRLAKIAAAAAAALATVPAWADAWVSSSAAASYVDVTKLVRESIDARMIENMRGERADGGSIWLDVKGAVTKADKAVAGTSGWDNDVYAANLGADIKKGDSFFGVVYTYANVDGKSKGTGAPIDTDIDFWGVSAFGQQTFGAMSVFGSAGWMYVTGDVSGAGAKSDMDGNIWTADIGVKGAANFGALSLVPYAKAELTYLAPENFAGGEPDNLRIYQFPVGVNAAWTLETTGWKLTPSVDLALVPTAGDTTATGKINGTPFETSFYNDSTYYRASLGISARGEHAVFGLKYRYLKGEDGYKMHSVGARAEYVF